MIIVTLTVTTISFTLLGTIIAAAFCIVMTCSPLFTSCHSRGESGQIRGPLSSNVEGYYGRNRQIQTQTQYQNPAYPNKYQQQSQSFVYIQPNYAPPSMPEYYDSRNPQYYNSRPSYSQNPYPPSSPALISSPQQAYNSPYPQIYNQQNSQSSSANSPPKINYQNVQTQQKPTFDSRIDAESAQSAAADGFVTRAQNKGTRRPPPITTRRPPPPLILNRFDDRMNTAFKKTLTYNSELSDSMEKFSLEIFDQFCLKFENENFMISPFSIFNLMVMVAEGANGNTFAEISNKLNLITITKTRDFQQYLNEALK